MIKTIHEHYQAFYSMLIVTTALANSPSDELDKDISKIVDFIGGACDLDEEVIAYCKKVICDDLVAISTTEDVNAFVNSHSYEAELEELDSLLMMKCDAVSIVESLGRVQNVNLNPDWFNYSSYKPYYPVMRYKQLGIASSTGHPVANKVRAVLSYLGIGVKESDKTKKEAIYRFKQCMVWGDIFSIRMLKYIYKLNGDTEKEKVYADLMKFIPFLKEGRTVVPKGVNLDVCKEAREWFAIISSIRQDVIINEQRTYIDYSFAEVILSEDIDYYTKLNYINNYRYQDWKEATNSSNDPNKKIGFKTGE